MRYCIHEGDAVPEGTADEAVEVRRLFGADRGCDPFEQRVVRLAGGASAELGSAAADELLFVLEGEGALEAGEERRPLGFGTGVLLPAGARRRVSNPIGDDLVVLSVLVLDPVDATGRGHAVVNLLEAGADGATAGRQFRLGVTPRSATQFLGYIPPGRAPDHFHRYDEVVYVLDGEGTLHIGGETAPLRRGSCVHLPARLVHCLENTGSDAMTVLGVFRPPGSPAEAYYPDGTPAVTP